MDIQELWRQCDESQWRYWDDVQRLLEALAEDGHQNGTGNHERIRQVWETAKAFRGPECGPLPLPGLPPEAFRQQTAADELWEWCEQNNWGWWLRVQDLIRRLESAGEKERAAQARKEYTRRHGPPTEDLARYTYWDGTQGW